jgi:N-acetylmuramoyl-L-alanine amidase
MGRACWIWVVLYFLGSSAVWAVDVHDVRLWRAPDHTRIVFDLTGPADYSLLVLSNPSRIVLDIQDTNLRTNLADLNLVNTPVSLVRSGVREGDDLRIVIEVSARLDPRSFVRLPGVAGSPCGKKKRSGVC